MNHKRKKPRNARAGCKMCKPWKVNGFDNRKEGGEPFSDHKRRYPAGSLSRDLQESLANAKALKERME